MFIDLYTKFVLSFIAIALWGLLITSLVKPEVVSAKRDIVDVNLVEINNKRIYDGIDVNIKRVNDLRLVHQYMPVKIVD